MLSSGVDVLTSAVYRNDLHDDIPLSLVVGMKGFEPSISCSRNRRFSQAKLHPDSEGPLALLRFLIPSTGPVRSALLLLAPTEGLEPPTSSFVVMRSIQLSYAGKFPVSPGCHVSVPGTPKGAQVFFQLSDVPKLLVGMRGFEPPTS